MALPSLKTKEVMPETSAKSEVPAPREIISIVSTLETTPIPPVASMRTVSVSVPLPPSISSSVPKVSIPPAIVSSRLVPEIESASVVSEKYWPNKLLT